MYAILLTSGGSAIRDSFSARWLSRKSRTHANTQAKGVRYNRPMQRKVFWMTFTALGLIADLALPFWWALGATIPVGMLAWWIAYRSDWF